MFAALPLALPYFNNEYLRPLAVASARRTALLPALPTWTESGIPHVDIAAWHGIFAHGGISPNVIRWLKDHIGKSLYEAATRNQVVLLGLESRRECWGQGAKLREAYGWCVARSTRRGGCDLMKGFLKTNEAWCAGSAAKASLAGI